MRRAAILMVLAVAAPAGCGGGDEDGGGEPLSASAFKAKANAICRDTARANEAAMKGIDRDDTDGLAKATRDVGRRTQAALDDLGDLEGPDRAEDQVDRFLDLAEAFADAAKQQSDALAKGDPDAAQRASGEADRLNAEAQQAARDAGLDACAS